jgi:hypothetical protein
MPSYDVGPHKRWNPQPSWLQEAFHPPERGHLYEVKITSDGTSFEAYLSYDGVWRHGGASGTPLTTVTYLFWLSKT